MPKSMLSSEILRILESTWAEGMQDCSSEENKLKVQQVAAATGLVDERVKCWIYNRNRKVKKEGGHAKKMRLSSSKEKTCDFVKGVTQPDAERLFENVTKNMDSAGGIKEQNNATVCFGVTQTDVEKMCGDISEEMGGGPPGQNDLLQNVCFEEEEPCKTLVDTHLEDQENQQETAAQLLQNIEDNIQKLQGCNYNVLFMAYNQKGGSLYTTGTPKGLEFLKSQSPGIQWLFAGAMSNTSSESSHI